MAETGLTSTGAGRRTTKRTAARRTTEETRALILETAATLFCERGYERTSMAELARRVGITAAGLYWHFDAKDEILTEYLATVLQDLLRSAATADEQGSPEDALREFATRHACFQLERLEGAKVFGTVAYGHDQLKQSLRPEQRDRLHELERRHLANLETILREGQQSGAFSIVDISAVAFAIIAIGEHTIHWFHPGGELSSEQLGEIYGELAVRMVTARPDEQ